MHKLEKLNSSIDIIPLQGSSMEVRRKSVEKHRPDEASTRSVRDPVIISRVQMYLYENEDKVYIDVNDMADYLQRKYRDYRGKKRGLFRAMVRRAYDEITENVARRSDPKWADDEDEIDVESDPQNETLPNELLKMYKRGIVAMGRQNGNSSDKELIDISSDDEQVKSGSGADVPVERDISDQEIRSPLNKKPHLSTCYDSPKVSTPTVMEMVIKPMESSVDKVSKKRPREKDNENNSYKDSQTVTKRKKDVPVTKSVIKFSDVGGNEKVLKEICQLLTHMKHPEVFKQLGISPPRGFLLHGPPGCGKTLLANAIAGELSIPLIKVAAPELVAGVSGESESKIRDLFEQAVAVAPCILFLDEIDAIAPHRATAQKEMERRMVAQLLSCLDDLSTKENGNSVLVIGATNRPDALDPALRRAGRFDREVCMGIPDKEARAAILKVHASKLTLAPDVSLEKLATLTPGFVGADLIALITEAAMAAVNRIFLKLKTKASKTENEDIEEMEATIENQDKIEEIEPVEIEKTPDEVSEMMPEEASEEAQQDKEESEKTENPIISETEDVANVENSEDVEEMATEVANEIDLKESEKKSDDELVTISEDPQKTVELVESESVSDVLAVKPDDESEKIPKQPKKTAVLELNDLLTLLNDEPPLTTEQLATLCIEEQDFNIALQTVQPSAKREGFATVPDVTWDDVGSLQDIRQELQMSILAPIRHSEYFKALGLNTPTGVLLCGPPGCGKTLLAKAIANEAGINFISVKGPELLNMYVGESEKAVRTCFMRARNSAPCVIFFDELDALCPKRSEGDSSSTARVVNQMLTEMDGVEGRKGVFLMAASNRPDIIDPAVLRPGRLDKILYVGLPNADDRVDILRALTKNGTNPKLGSDINLVEVARYEKCEGYTGADLAALVRESAVEALRELMINPSSPVEISARHIEAAFDKIRPSVLAKDIKHYEKLEKLYSVPQRNRTDVKMNLIDPMEI